MSKRVCLDCVSEAGDEVVITVQGRLKKTLKYYKNL